MLTPARTASCRRPQAHALALNALCNVALVPVPLRDGTALGDLFSAVGCDDLPRTDVDLPRLARALRDHGGALSPRGIGDRHRRVRHSPVTFLVTFLIAFLIATEDRLSAALIRYVIKSSARGAFDAGEIIDLAATRFGEVSAELIARKRKEWRRATMEVHYAKLRVKELYEAQQQVGTFAVEQARSLVLALGIEGQPPTTKVPEAAVIEHLSRHLPEEEIEVVVTFLRSTASLSSPSVGMEHLHTPVDPLHASRRHLERQIEVSKGQFPGWPEYNADAPALNANQVAVGVAVLSDGKPDARLRLCFDAFDVAGCGGLGSEALVALLHAIYRTHYKQPPTDAEVRAAAQVIFSNMSESGPTAAALGGAQGGALLAVASPAVCRGSPTPPDSGSGAEVTISSGSGSACGAAASAHDDAIMERLLPRDEFLRLAMAQPTLMQCFVRRGARPLLTPRGVSQRDKMPDVQSALEMVTTVATGLLLPACAFRDKPRHHKEKLEGKSIQPRAGRSPFMDDRLLAAAAKEQGTAARGGPVPQAPNPFDGLLDGFNSITRSFTAFLPPPAPPPDPPDTGPSGAGTVHDTVGIHF